MLMTLRDSSSPGSFVHAKADVAAFLVARGPYAYLGTGWHVTNAHACMPGVGAGVHDSPAFVRCTSPHATRSLPKVP